MNYPWGNTFYRSKLWCSSYQAGDMEKTGAVDRTNRIDRNGYGLSDMVGNVWEWCVDYTNYDYRPIGKDPVCTRKSDSRSVRGGS